MPDPSAAPAAASAATDPATLGAWAALVAAVGLAWRRIAGRAKPAPAAAPQGPTLAQQVAQQGQQVVQQGQQVAGLGHMYQQVATELTEVREQLRAMPTKDDLRDLVDRLEAGLTRLEEAGERRVAKLHARIDAHLEHHPRNAA